MYPRTGDDISVQIVEAREDGKLRTRLVIENLGDEPLAEGWRLYFSVGLTPARHEQRLRQVLVEGRYGYLEPTDAWQPLSSGESAEFDVRNWLFAGQQLAGAQGFHLTTVSNQQETLLGAPRIRPPQLAPTQLENPYIPTLSPSCDVEPFTPQHSFELNRQLPADAQSTDARLSLIPAPSKLTHTGDAFKVTGIHVAESHFPKEAQHIRDYLQARGLLDADGIVLEMLPGEAPRSGYKLDTKDAAITLLCDSSEAAMYGLQTLKQLLTQEDDGWTLPSVHIEDAPDFEHRALFIDLARHFHDAAQLRKIISAMALYKLNRLQLGICNDEGWRLEIPEIPELTDIGAKRSFHAVAESGTRQTLYPAWGDDHQEVSGHLSQADFVALLRHAAEHHVEIIVEFNLPGHANAILCALEGTDYQLIDKDDESTHQSAQGYTRNVVNVCMTDTYRFARTVIQSVNSCYEQAGVPLRRLHFGGDEVAEGAWLGSPVCHASDAWNPAWDMDNAKDREAATAALTRHFAENLSRVAREVAPDLQLGFWHEMAPHATGVPDTYFNAWTTEAGDAGQGGLDEVNAMLEQKQRIVISNASFLYLDMPYALHADEPGLPWGAYIPTRRILEFDPLGCWQIPESKRHLVAGLQAQLWSETIFTRVLMDYHLFPRLLAFAERCWNRAPAQQHWPMFAAAVGERELNRLHELGIAFRIPPPGAAVENGTLNANVAYPGLGIRYTTDGTDPTAESNLFTEPVPVPSGAEIKLASFHVDSGRRSRVVSVEGAA